MNTFACIDIGGTAIKYGLIDAQGTVLFSDEAPTEARKGGDALAEKVRGLAAALIEKDPTLKGIAISSAGVVNTDKAEIIHASDAIPGYRGINYKDRLKEFNLPVEMENDVNCAGLCETASGPAANSRPAMVLTVGTGIGGCLVTEDGLYHGNTYSACEVGYFPINGIPFEKQASTSAMVRELAAMKNEPEENWNGRRIFEEAEKGDQDCQEAIDRLCDRLGEGIAALCFILNPESVILGGGIMARDDMLRPKIEASFQKHSIPLIADSTRLEFAASQNAAGMKGALVHFLQKHPELNR